MSVKQKISVLLLIIALVLSLLALHSYFSFKKPKNLESFDDGFGGGIQINIEPYNLFMGVKNER